MENLSKVSQEIAQQAYQETQQASGQGEDATTASSTDDAASEDDGEYIDAEYDEQA